MKKILAFLLFLLCVPAQSAQVVNVEYIHNAIRQKWGVMVPYNSELTNPRVVANMKYLLTAVDVANEILNGGRLTDYGNGEYATMAAVDTIATDTAVDRLIVKDDTDYKLSLTHSYIADMRDPNSLIMISAAGTYNIDWGDGVKEVIEKDTVGEQWFGHNYASDGEYIVRIGGQASEYSSDPDLSTVKLGNFVENDFGAAPLLGLTDIDGCLGCVFPTLEDGSQPRFIDTFAETYDLFIDIPSGLFTGVSGAPVDNMFKQTFSFAAITSIPADLFAGIQGPPAASMFEGTFSATYIESIPAGLFAGIQGPPAKRMFARTFNEGYIESIPEYLFAGIQGPPAESMFEGTFNANFNLTSIPENLFAGIQGPPAESMFEETFNANFNLTSIPENLFAGIQGSPAESMFEGTFSFTYIESIPAGLFAGIDTTKSLQDYSFLHTFANCYSLTGPSARINGRYLYEIWPDAKWYQVNGMYLEATGLDDYADIPDIWKSY